MIELTQEDYERGGGFLVKEEPSQPSTMTQVQKSDWGDCHATTATKVILIVEDDENNSDLLQALLTSRGVKSIVARDSREAVDYCRVSDPAVILMDIGLPGTNGLELTHFIKSSDVWENVPIVAVSAHYSERMKDLAEEAGCCGFIAKPWSSEDIMKIVDKYYIK